jgi:hypothetical protein
MTAIACPICSTNAQDYTASGTDGKNLDCKRCGKFSITVTASAMWSPDNGRKLANASGWIRQHQGINLTSENINFLKSIRTPSINERADNILKHIVSKSEVLSSSFIVESEIIDEWHAISYSINSSELDYLLRVYLKDELGFISFQGKQNKFTDGNFIYDISITPKGYTYLDNHSNSNPESQIGFCAMWFDNSVLSTWLNAIEPAIKDAGYDAKRIDSHHHNNRIDDEIVAMLRRSKFVVADFTGQRGGVYFEAGFALGLGLQVIWTCKKSELNNNHFDTRQYNFVTWEDGKLDEFKAALQNRIEATIGRGNLQQPLTPRQATQA